MLCVSTLLINLVLRTSLSLVRVGGAARPLAARVGADRARAGARAARVALAEAWREAKAIEAEERARALAAEQPRIVDEAQPSAARATAPRTAGDGDEGGAASRATFAGGQRGARPRRVAGGAAAATEPRRSANPSRADRDEAETATDESRSPRGDGRRAARRARGRARASR